jgi:signal transduction histidine kinase
MPSSEASVPDRNRILRVSIFARLLTIMVLMAVALLGIVSLVFIFAVFPSAMTEGGRSLAHSVSRAIAATSPDFETAKNVARSLKIQIRYEGPRGSWTTSPNLPYILPVKNGEAYPDFGHEFYLESASDGGSYLFVWEFGEHVRALHAKLLWLLLFLMTGVVCTAYVFQRRLLRPVRLLDDGVERLSAGDLNVVVPVVTSDEFGALTEAFNQMAGRVKQMIQARDQLLLDVSHELRSPLTRLKVALALLPDDENRAGMAGDLNEMETMIAELLELERIRDGRGMRRQTHDLASVLREVVEGYKKGVPGIRMVLPGCETLLAIDCEKIKTVLRNVLDNALKYSLPDSRPVEVYLERDTDKVTVRICDDGPGIPDADIAYLFEPFYRVDRSRSKKTGGYGLGLSICKRIMEAHGGTIAATNKPNRGASFTLTFPTSSPGYIAAGGRRETTGR